MLQIGHHHVMWQGPQTLAKNLGFQCLLTKISHSGGLESRNLYFLSNILDDSQDK